MGLPRHAYNLSLIKDFFFDNQKGIYNFVGSRRVKAGTAAVLTRVAQAGT